MNKSEPNHGKRGVLMRVLAVLGPGIFAIGYTIGTGSVTSMAKAGADYGLGLVWVLALSCIFSGVLMEAYGRLAAVTGETSLTAIRRHLPFGRTFAWAVFAGVVVGVIRGSIQKRCAYSHLQEYAKQPDDHSRHMPVHPETEYHGGGSSNEPRYIG